MTTTTKANQTRAEWISQWKLIGEYQHRSNGGHYFDPGTLRWFNARVSQDALQLPSGAILFTESTKNLSTITGADYPRRYSLCVLLPSGQVEKPHGFEAFASCSKAKRALDRFAKTHAHTPPVLFSGNMQYAAAWAAHAAALNPLRNRAESGATPAQVDAARRNSESWAKAARCRLDWSHFKPGLLLPRKRRPIPFSQWAPVINDLFGKEVA